jgi:hypothetical protein
MLDISQRCFPNVDYAADKFVPIEEPVNDTILNNTTH